MLQKFVKTASNPSPDPAYDLSTDSDTSFEAASSRAHTAIGPGTNPRTVD